MTKYDFRCISQKFGMKIFGPEFRNQVSVHNAEHCPKDYTARLLGIILVCVAGSWAAMPQSKGLVPHNLCTIVGVVDLLANGGFLRAKGLRTRDAKRLGRRHRK